MDVSLSQLTHERSVFTHINQPEVVLVRWKLVRAYLLLQLGGIGTLQNED